MLGNDLGLASSQTPKGGINPETLVTQVQGREGSMFNTPCLPTYKKLPYYAESPQFLSSYS